MDVLNHFANVNITFKLFSVGSKISRMKEFLTLVEALNYVLTISFVSKFILSVLNSVTGLLVVSLV